MTKTPRKVAVNWWFPSGGVPSRTLCSLCRAAAFIAVSCRSGLLQLHRAGDAVGKQRFHLTWLAVKASGDRRGFNKFRAWLKQNKWTMTAGMVVLDFFCWFHEQLLGSCLKPWLCHRESQQFFMHERWVRVSLQCLGPPSVAFCLPNSCSLQR